jgi:hypothetical protein
VKLNTNCSLEFVEDGRRENGILEARIVDADDASGWWLRLNIAGAEGEPAGVLRIDHDTAVRMRDILAGAGRR